MPHPNVRLPPPTLFLTFLLLSWLLLGEAPTPVMLLGGALCLLGVAITRMMGR